MTPSSFSPGASIVSVIAALLLALAALTACDRPANPAKPSKIDTNPHGHTRIVALAPAFSQMLRASGAQSLLVGRHAYDAWSDPALPVCGDQSGVDYERLLAVQPTHLIVQRDATPTPARLIEMASQRGWTLIELPLLTLDDVQRAGERTEQLVRDAGLVPAPPAFSLAALSAPPAGTFTGTVLLLHGTDPPTALGPGSYHHDLLLRVGGRPAIVTGKPYITLDAEEVARLNPAAIVLIQPARAGAAQTPPNARRAEALRRLGSLGRLPIAAATDGRVTLIDDSTALVPGTNLAQVGAELDTILQGWRATP